MAVEPETSVLYLSLTLDQASKLRGLLDVAVRSSGLTVVATAAEIDALVLEADRERNLKPAAGSSTVEN